MVDWCLIPFRPAAVLQVVGSIGVRYLMISIFSLGRIRLRVTAVLTAAIFPIVCAAIELPPLKIPRVSRAPKLSDFLNDTPREAEAVVIIFKQFDPHDGEPVSQPTAA